MDQDLIDGAETIVDQCLQIKKNEKVLLLNDNNDKDLFEALFQVLEDRNIKYEYLEYPEPESSGTEPPKNVSEKMKQFDVVIAPTLKSISHTEARKEANEQGTRVASMPTVNKQIWKTSLQADYQRVKEITEKIYKLLENTSRVRIETPSGTDIEFDVEYDTFHTDTGIINKPGDFGNLPAGEPSGYPANIEGELVLDHFPFSPKTHKVEIKDAKVVSLQNKEGEKTSELEKVFEETPCAKNMAEFGFGTNPEATIIGNTLQDEKVLGTVHIAFGDNCSYVKEGDNRRNPCDIHWDSVCEKPTVWFDDEKVLDRGEPVFLDN